MAVISAFDVLGPNIIGPSGSHTAVAVAIALLARISKCLSDCNVHIAFMKLFREEKGAQAYCIVESDERLPLEITDWINSNPHVYHTMLVQV